MESTDSENSLNGTPPKPKVSWRLGEDGKYNNKPLSVTYFKDYYHNKIKAKVECEYCHKMTGAQKLKRHQTSKACHKFQI